MSAGPSSSSSRVVFCRALFNYDAQDSSCLSFRQNDIIEILSRQPSGWWDGLLGLGDERGWFPSNYVVVISDEEAELAFSDSEFPTSDPKADTHADKKPCGPQGMEELAGAGPSLEIADFWMPEVTSDGRIYYVNTQTGQHTQDLPYEGMEVALGRGKDKAEPELPASGSMSSQPIGRDTLNDVSHLSTEDAILSPDSPTLEEDYLEPGPPMYEEVESPSSANVTAGPIYEEVESPVGSSVASAGPSRPTFRCTPTLPQQTYGAEIMIDLEGTVRGGTVPALVERLTTHERLDQTFNKSFLMTFKSFTTVDELFDLLLQRFWIQPPPKMNDAKREEWRRLKQHVIQIRVLNIFKSLVLDSDVLEKADLGIFNRIQEFITTAEVARFPAAKQLSTLIERARQGDITIKMVAAGQGVPPSPLVPKSKKLKLLDIEPLELARQLTIKDSRMYQRIRPMECLQRIWEPNTDIVDNITVFVQTNNKITLWVAESILNKDDSRRRAGIIEQFIGVADHCRTLKNFSSLVAIMAGLNTPGIRRLTRTWAQVSPKAMAQFDACDAAISSDSGFLTYRRMIDFAVPPCVPFVGIFLSNLQFVVDGFPDNFPAQGGKDGAESTLDLINFRKRQKAAELIQDLKRWQVPFNLHVIPSIQAFMEHSLNSVSDTPEASERFEAISLELEPRELAEEKMARLLQDSGFM